MNKKKIKTIGFCICGSFCTISKAIQEMKKLKQLGFKILPIMSFTAYQTDTRFGKAKDIVNTIETIAEQKIIKTISAAEPIGPKNLTDLILIEPCTSNTLSKLEKSITDTPVTMAVKSHLRTLRPVVIALASNDALGSTAKNLGSMLNKKLYYFVPMKQDDPILKPNSLVADFELTTKTVKNAFQGKQTRPLFLA